MERPLNLVDLGQGMLIERDVLNVIEKIHAYDENLQVQYLNPEALKSIGDAPYRIIERCPDGEYRTVFSVWELDERVLQRLYAADMSRNDILGRLDNNNAAVREMQKRRYKEALDEAADIAKHVIQSPKGRYTIPTDDGGVVKIHDDRPHERIK